MLFGDGRELLVWLTIQSITAAEDLIISVLARVIGKPLMDHFQKLDSHRIKLPILQLFDL